MPGSDAPRPIDLPAVAGVVLCCALWGGNAVAVKFAVPDVPPFGCAGLRFLLAMPVVAALCRASGRPMWVPREHLWLVAAHALLSVLQIGTFNWGTNLSLAGRSSVFINVHPLVVAPLSWLVLGERMGPRGVSGLIAAGLGVAVLLGGGQPTGGSLLGDAIVLLSGAIFGAQTVAQKRTFPTIPPATLLFAQYVLAIPIFLAYSGVVEGFSTYRFTPGAIWGVLFQGVAVSGLCFSVWMTLLGRYQANKIAAFAFLTPIFGVALGSLMRGEPLRWELIAAGALVGVGILLVSTDRVAHKGPPVIALPGEDAP